MIAGNTIWGIIRGHVPRKQWVASKDIYAIVEKYGTLDDEDRRPQSPRSTTPRWMALVRDVLASRLNKGGVRSRRSSDHRNDLAR